MVKVLSMKQPSTFLGLCGALLAAAPVAAAPASPPPQGETATQSGATARPQRVEAVGDARWSDSIGFVAPGEAPASAPAVKSPVLDVPAKAGDPQQREPKRGQ